MPVHGPRQIVSETEEGIKKEVVFKTRHWEALEALAKQRDQSTDDVLSTLIEAHIQERKEDSDG